MNKQHFPALDGLRGVAAISVVLYHYTYAGAAWFPQGYLAVDLFFVLSGFVIAFSYEDRLRSGLSPGGFVVRRLIRLYPMIAVASVLGGLAAYAKLAAQSNGTDPASLLGLLLCSLTLFPQLQDTYLGKEIFPLNVVLWTLFFELVANLAYGLFAFKLRSRYLIAAVAGCLIVLALSGPLGGNLTDDFLPGFPRVIVGFFAGVLLYRHRRLAQFRSWNPGFVPLSVAILLAFWLPVVPQGAVLVAVFGLFAVVVSLGAAIPAPRSAGKVLRGLGDLSYPLYALHLPLHGFLAAAERKLPIVRFLPATGLEILSTLCVVGASAAVLKLFDEPIRARLTRHLVRKSRSAVVPG